MSLHTHTYIPNGSRDQPVFGCAAYCTSARQHVNVSARQHVSTSARQHVIMTSVANIVRIQICRRSVLSRTRVTIVFAGASHSILPDYLLVLPFRPPLSLSLSFSSPLVTFFGDTVLETDRTKFLQQPLVPFNPVRDHRVEGSAAHVVL